MRDVLESMTKTDLTSLAAELEIVGRSSMTKAQLIDAILATQEGGV
ncbi:MULTISPECIES: Rho termination factor N-terminal domain-containing protein [Exiguobacterium]|nr:MULTISPECIES: Rho termination factor N-terminal domain-containing protein [Exiguobacterium]MCT4779830.1 Rho termination factor N-terminal domain-containing protein [Exiguobacterium soli]